MNPVLAKFTAVDQKFPVGTNAAGFLLTLTPIADPAAPGAAGSPPAPVEPAKPITRQVALDAREITVEDVPPGRYNGKIALIDIDGAELAPPAVDPAVLVITVISDVVLPVPTTLSLTRP